MRITLTCSLILLLAPCVRAQDTVRRLDTIRVTSVREQPAGFIMEFEERRVRGVGHFLTAKQLRELDDRSFGDVLRTKLSGVALRSNAEGTFVYSRSGLPPRAMTTNALKHCFVQIVMDGIITYSMSTSDENPPDMAELLTRNFEAVEFYSNAATTPPEYRSTGASCGTLILWSRRT